MPIHYMILDGERFDFPFGISMRDFIIINNRELFFPEDSPLRKTYYTKDEQYFRSKKIQNTGECFNMYHGD